MAKMINIGICKLFLIGQFKNAIAIGGTEELTFTVEQLECVPMARIVASSKDDTAIGLKPRGDRKTERIWN